jgi:hypothetical protein
MQKLISLIEVVLIRSGRCETVRDTGAGIHTNMGFQSGKDSVLPHHPPLRTVRESPPHTAQAFQQLLVKPGITAERTLAEL